MNPCPFSPDQAQPSFGVATPCLFPIRYSLFPTSAFIIHEERKTAAKADILVAGVYGTSKLVPFLLKRGAEQSFAGGHTMPFPYSLLPTRFSLFPIPYFLLPAFLPPP